MYQLLWAQKARWQQEAHSASPASSNLEKSAVRRAALLEWREHCLECAIPVCFTSCSLYVPRADKLCSRFVYGIYPNPGFQGLFDFGADIRFRRWGKLEALFFGKSGYVRTHRILDNFNRMAAAALDGGSAPAPGTNFGRRLRDSVSAFGQYSLSKARDKYLAWGAPGAGNCSYDAFVLECYSPENSPFRLVLEYSVGEMAPDHTFVGQIHLRQSFEIVPGWNFHTLPGQPFAPQDDSHVGKITIYPENSVEVRLIFTWLDLVQYRKTVQPVAPQAKAGQPASASKVKCVAWDLDNTLWKGILAEDTESRLEPRPEALDLIKSLDERGILQTLVSKNNHADAWPIIERLGLQDYFLYPAINWAPKSSNLKQIAASLNINVDTFALIDDSPFERAEVQSVIPQIRVYSEDQMGQLLSLPEFDVPVTDTGRNRRASYLTEMKRDLIKEEFGGNYEGFLRSCGMKLRLFVPREEAHVTRCLELIQRSNQLNLSNNRYGAEEFRVLLSRPDFLCVAMDCEDRFGKYGIVGFASIDERGEQPTLRDLVLSCRVAQKRVEHAFVYWLAKREMDRGMTSLSAEVVKTERNMPIRQVFEDLAFRAAGQQANRHLMELPLTTSLPHEDVVAVEDQVQLASTAPELIQIQGHPDR
jgi:FkbH-like protein